MKCYNCGAQLSEVSFCTNCKRDVSLYKKIIYMSNRLYNEGLEKAGEDELCAAYLKSLLTEGEMPGIDRKLPELRFGAGSHFFNPELRDIFPEQDFWMCIARDRFGFVLRIEKDSMGFVSRKIIV